MNKARRQKIEEAMSILSNGQELIEGVKDEEEASFDNLPEGLQSSMRGEQMQENIDALDEAVCYIQDVLTILDGVIG